ncbi:hypothetical protein Y717_27750 [Streptomyces scopuliridis RB72]|uniref:Uncharacterized protein n=1 Tax=Streptomyces scopuliridis RB72 TaxID=1440053 RepID=A0A2T7TCC8_9ACTN|nr:hypothetical protein Y717_27750 [Streptomyces scopuliridis RB72]
MPELPRTPEEGLLRGRHRLQGLRVLPERQSWLVVEQRACFDEFLGFHLGFRGYEVVLVVGVQGPGVGLVLFRLGLLLGWLRVRFGLQLQLVEQLQRLFGRLTPLSFLVLFRGDPAVLNGRGLSRTRGRVRLL